MTLGRLLLVILPVRAGSERCVGAAALFLAGDANSEC